MATANRPPDPPEAKALARLDRAMITAADLKEVRSRIARASTVLEAKQCREWLGWVADYHRRRRRLQQTQALRHQFTEIELECSEGSIEGWRREGDLLRMMSEAGQRQPHGKVKLQRVTSPLPTLADLGYAHNLDAKRAIDLSLIPDAIVLAYFQSQRARREPATVAGLISFAADAEKRTVTATPELPPGQYRTIVIDPPWPMEKLGLDVDASQGRLLDYPTMSLEEIRALPVATLAGPGAHLYLWTTHRFLPDAFPILETWGFAYHCLLTWLKPGGMTPFSFQFNTEHVLFGYRDALEVLRQGLKVGFEAPRTGHSRKPAAFYDLVEEASPGPRIELFARAPRPDWTVWGDELADRDV
jgi:N6-adenosine-specific RNA methylase IME4